MSTAPHSASASTVPYGQILAEILDTTPSATPLNRAWVAKWVNQGLLQERLGWERKQESLRDDVEAHIKRFEQEQKDHALITKYERKEVLSLTQNTLAPTVTLVGLIKEILNEKMPLTDIQDKELERRAAISREKISRGQTPQSDTFGEYLHLELMEQEGREISMAELLRQLKVRVASRNLEAQMEAQRAELTRLNEEKAPEKDLSYFDTATHKTTKVENGQLTAVDVAAIERGAVPSAALHAEIAKLFEPIKPADDLLEKLNLAHAAQSGKTGYTPPRDPVMDELVEISGRQADAYVPQTTPSAALAVPATADKVADADGAVKQRPEDTDLRALPDRLDDKVLDAGTKDKRSVADDDVRLVLDKPAGADGAGHNGTNGVVAPRPAYLDAVVSPGRGQLRERPKKTYDEAAERLAAAFIAVFRQTGTDLPSLDVTQQRAHQPTIDRFKQWGLEDKLAQDLHRTLTPGKMERVKTEILDALPAESRYREVLVKYNEAVVVMHDHLEHLREGISYKAAGRALLDFAREKRFTLSDSVTAATQGVNGKFDASKEMVRLHTRLIDDGKIKVESDGAGMPTPLQEFVKAYDGMKANRDRLSAEYVEALGVGYAAGRSMVATTPATADA